MPKGAAGFGRGTWKMKIPRFPAWAQWLFDNEIALSAFKTGLVEQAGVGQIRSLGRFVRFTDEDVE